MPELVLQIISVSQLHWTGQCMGHVPFDMVGCMTGC